MKTPIVIFGITTENFTNKVFSLRKEIHKNGFDEKSDQILTLPHLTLAVNKNFESVNINKLVNHLSVFFKTKNKFSIKLKGFTVKDKNIAAIFDNTFTATLAKELSKDILNLGFERVITDHMRIIRSNIKEEYLEKVRNRVEKTLPNEIEIVGIAVAGKLIREKDIIWKMNLS